METNNQSIDAHGNHIPRPSNSFMLYSKDKRPLLQGNARDKSKLIGELWHVELADVRAHYERRAEDEKKRHAEKYPDYVFHPQKKHKGQTRVRKRAKSQAKMQSGLSLNMGMPMAKRNMPGYEVGVASPLTVSSPESSGPLTPRDISPVLATPSVPISQPILGAPLKYVTVYEVNGKGEGKERARDTVLFYNLASLPSQPGRSLTYNNVPARLISETVINHSTVETSDISAFDASHEGANNISVKQSVQVNPNKRTTGVSVFRFGFGQNANFQPVFSDSFVPSASVDNTGTSTSSATVIPSTPNPTKLLADHHTSRKVTETVGSGTSRIDNVNTSVQGSQASPVLPSSLPPSAFIKNPAVSSSSPAINHLTPIQLLSAYYAGRETSAERVTNNTTHGTFPEATTEINSMPNPSVLIADRGASNFCVTPRSTAAVQASTFSSLAEYNVVPQAPFNRLAGQTNKNFFGRYRSMNEAAAAFVHAWLSRGGIQEACAQIAQIEKFVKEVNGREAQSGAPAPAMKTLHLYSNNAYCGGHRTSVGGLSVSNAPYAGPARIQFPQ
ncbi:HMG-box protein STE11 [Termitomyces sp. T112]|nr:HMG-box protein STE11 [Termitomyces sp. T112]